MKTKTIPFDLETAEKIQVGEIEGKIKTEGGENARIICWNRKTEHNTPIVALIDYNQREELYFYSEAGEYDFGSFPMLNLVLEVPDRVPDNKPQFKPFDKVLVRDDDEQEWRCDLFSHIINTIHYRYMCVTNTWHYCIPYEGNEHLVGTTEKPKEE